MSPEYFKLSFRLDRLESLLSSFSSCIHVNMNECTMPQIRLAWLALVWLYLPLTMIELAYCITLFVCQLYRIYWSCPTGQRWQVSSGCSMLLLQCWARSVTSPYASLRCIWRWKLLSKGSGSTSQAVHHPWTWGALCSLFRDNTFYWGCFASEQWQAKGCHKPGIWFDSCRNYCGG